MAKRAKKKRIGTKYLENGKEVDINEYLSRGIGSIGVLNNPQIEVIEQKLRSMPYDDMIHRRHKGKDSLQIEAIYEEPTYESVLSIEQINQFLPIANRYVFAKALSSEDMLEWLMCQNEEPIKVVHNGLLAYMMYLLSVKGWICENCQTIADERKTFVSKNGVPIKKKNLSKSLCMMAKRMDYPVDNKGVWILNNELYNAIMGLIR